MTLLTAPAETSAQQSVDTAGLVRVAQMISQPNLLVGDLSDLACERQAERAVAVHAIPNGPVIYFEVFTGPETIGCSYLLAYGTDTRRMYRLEGFAQTEARNFFAEVDDYLLRLIPLQKDGDEGMKLYERLECLRRFSRLSQRRQERRRQRVPCGEVCGEWLIIH